MRPVFVHIISCILGLALVLRPEVATGATKTSTTIPMKVNGRDGVWLPNETAEHALWEVEKHVPALEKTIDAQDHLVEAQRLVIETSSTTLHVQKELTLEEKARADALSQTATKDEKAADAARKELDAWYRSPMFWFGSGVVTTAIGIAVIAALVHGTTITVQK